MQSQNLSEPVFFIASSSTIIKLLHFKWIIVTHNEHPIKFVQLTDLLHVLKVTLVDIRPETFNKKKEKDKKRRKKIWWLSLWKLCYIYPLITDAITLIFKEPVRIYYIQTLVYRTLAYSEPEAYSEPWCIQNSGIFKTRGVLRTLVCS